MGRGESQRGGVGGALAVEWRLFISRFVFFVN